MVKKTYCAPKMETVKIKTSCMLAVSGGVKNGSTVGNAYNDNDVTYGRDFDFEDEE